MKHNDFLAYVLERAGQLGAVTKRDVSPWEVIHKSAMKFRVEAYEISGIGYLSVIRMSAMLGLMKMDTAVLTPVCKDAPLFSYDIIHALGNDTLLLELYDTQLQAVEGMGTELLSGVITAKTAVCTMVFTLFHWPCATTLMTFYRQTHSIKKTAAALLLPTAVGAICCLILHLVL